jgi:photosystem II stability/assembly factor-like uncharacterized protein
LKTGWDGALNYKDRRLFGLSVVVGGVILGLASPEIRAVPWFPFGPDGGDARAFAADPKDARHIYLGTANGWIYQSLDGGTQWSRLKSVGNRNDLVLDNILVDPMDTKHLAVGAWVSADLHSPDAGLFVSSDGGATWTRPAEMRGQAVLSLTLAPSDPRTMVAGTFEGVFRSVDGGEHWQRISPTGDKELHEVESLAIDPADPDTIYAGTWHLPWKTTDGGKTWKSIKQGIIDDSDVFSIIVDPKQPSTVYVSACSGIYKSEDAGAKFTGGVGQNKAQGIPSTARRTRVLMQDPNHLDTVFAGTTEGLYRTGDAGKLWTEMTSSDVIVNDVYVDPSNSQHVLLATDHQGVLASEDGGSSFVPSNRGFSTRLITAFTADAQHPATLYVGAVNDKQWGGVFVSHTDGLSWSQMSLGLDGRDVFSLGQAPDGTILAGTAHGIYRLKDGVWERAGATRSVLAAAGTKSAAGRTAHAKGGASAPHGGAATSGGALKNFDGSVYGIALTGETLYAATSEGLLRSPSSGLTWAAATGIPLDEYHILAAARSNVLAASLGAVELSTDGGNHWRQVALPAQVTQVSAASVDGQGGIWVAGREGVYYSADQGASWQMPLGAYGRNANSIFFDEAANRVLVTSGESTSMAFAVQLPAMQVTTWDTGWNLRFLRPVGDHLLAGTLYDGIVVQPRMVESPLPGATTAQR